MPSENAVYLPRHAAVEGKIRRHENRLRAEAFGGGGGHGGMQAEAAGFVRGGADDGTRAFPGHDDGQALQIRLFAQFYRGVEGIHIDVYDLAHSEGEGWADGLGRSYHFLGR